MQSECQRVIRLYPAFADLLSVSQAQPKPGFSGAGVYRVGCEFGDFALRVWPTTGLPADRLRGLHDLLSFIHRKGVHEVSVPIVSGNGHSLVEVNRQFWQLEPWMPGDADFHTTPKTIRLKNTMRSLARWHQAASQFKPNHKTERWFGSAQHAYSPACRERHQALSTWLEGQLDIVDSKLRAKTDDSFRKLSVQIVTLVRQVGPRILGELNEAQKWSVPIQPCLRDVWHDHVLYTGDDITGLIDPGACRSENVATDLSRLLGSLVGDDVNQWHIALNEYAVHRPLANHERLLVGVLDRSAIVLSGLTWLRRRYLEPPHDAPQTSYQWNEVLQRLTTIHQRLQVLAETPPDSRLLQ